MKFQRLTSAERTGLLILAAALLLFLCVLLMRRQASEGMIIPQEVATETSTPEIAVPKSEAEPDDSIAPRTSGRKKRMRQHAGHTGMQTRSQKIGSEDKKPPTHPSGPSRDDEIN